MCYTILELTELVYAWNGGMEVQICDLEGSFEPLLELIKKAFQFLRSAAFERILPIFSITLSADLLDWDLRAIFWWIKMKW